MCSEELRGNGTQLERCLTPCLLNFSIHYPLPVGLVECGPEEVVRRNLREIPGHNDRSSLQKEFDRDILVHNGGPWANPPPISPPPHVRFLTSVLCVVEWDVPCRYGMRLDSRGFRDCSPPRSSQVGPLGSRPPRRMSFSLSLPPLGLISLVA